MAVTGRRKKQDISVTARRICVALGLLIGIFSAQASTVAAQSVYGFSMPANAFVRNCTAEQASIVREAANAAKRMLLEGGSDAQFRRWFGVARDNSQRSLEIQWAVEYARYYALEGLTLLGAAATTFTTVVTIDCKGGRSGILAHVSGPGSTVIYLDNPYWSLPDTPSYQHVSKASVLIHELTHLAGTDDYALQFGYSNSFQFALDLARYMPEWTVYNADNHEYFYNGE